MLNEDELRPTLWRTCRALANRTRLRIFFFVVEHPQQTVSEIAREVDVKLSMTSRSLRLLESRGLLVALRTGAYVKYSVATGNRANPKAGLITALTRSFDAADRDKRIEVIFSLATAFTHPRRIDIFRALRTRPHSFEQLQAASRISIWPLYRHLEKLERRGFIRNWRGFYRACRPANRLQRELMQLATA